MLKRGVQRTGYISSFITVYVSQSTGHKHSMSMIKVHTCGYNMFSNVRNVAGHCLFWRKHVQILYQIVDQFKNVDRDVA